MTTIIYLILSLVCLSALNFLVDHSKYWDESISAVQILLALTIVFQYVRQILRPVKKLEKVTDSLKNGKFEGMNGQLKGRKEFSKINEQLNSMFLNTRNAIQFIQDIEDGKLDVEYSDDQASQNELAQSLVNLRNKLNAIAVSEKERNWATEGLAKFVEILRANDDDIHSLSDKILSNLVKYIKANQGQLYILNDDDPDHEFLELSAFYAFDRKKFVENSIEIGQGLVGQAYLEKETIMMTEIPENYIKVTSGLGEANPRCILIVPLKINEIVYGVLELASFNKFKDYEVDFIEKIGESIASTISSAKVNHKTKNLLGDLQQQQEEMKAQEEEMRQNMEELQATQEEMARKEKEISRLLELSNQKEVELAQKLKEIEKIASELELENAMFTGLMDILADRITIKDKKGTYLRINKTKEEALRKQGIENSIGKSDRDFFGDEHFKKALALEKEIMDSGSLVMQKEEQLKMPDGSLRWALTTRAPFKNKDGKIMGTLVVSRDITKEKDFEEKLVQANKELERLKKK